MNIYYGIPSGHQINIEEKAIAERLISEMGSLPCHTRDFTIDDPYPFEAIKGTPSLIHAFHLSKAGLQCKKLAEKYRLPLLVTCTGLDVYADLFNSGLKAQIQDLLEYASGIIVPFSSMARFFKARLRTNPVIEVINPGVEWVISNSDFPSEHFSLDDKHRIIMLEGGLLPAKNQIFAIRALEKIAKQYADLQLVIIENPFDRHYSEKVKAEAAEKPWVKIIPRPEKELLPFLYKKAEIFLNVSHAEGYNPFLLRAMQTGRPVLAADIHGNNAYIQNETVFPGKGTGLLFSSSPGPSGYKRIHDMDDLIEKLRYLLENPQQAHHIGQRAAESIKKNFATKKELYMHLQFYKNILK
ncbi:MAG: glycosyltransferase family 4 protein [Candidatus Rifleibacteriota bacterium]